MYDEKITQASKSALLELGLSLKQYHDDIVLTGGWAPYFLTKDHFDHCGSIDIDLALKTTILPKYEDIRSIIEGLGYAEEHHSPFRFSNTIISPVDGKSYEMHLDLLCEKEGTRYISNNLHIIQEDLQAFVFDGVSLAFDFNFEHEITGILPKNGEATTTFKIIDLVGSFALKAHAFRGRAKEKDAYDIYALTHYDGSPQKAAGYFNKTVSNKEISTANQQLLNESLDIISMAFKDGNRLGPYLVERFFGETNKRFVVAGQVNLFLKNTFLSS